MVSGSSGFGHVKSTVIARVLDFRMVSDSSGFGHVKSASLCVLSDVEFEWADSSGFGHVKSDYVAPYCNLEV